MNYIYLNPYQKQILMVKVVSFGMRNVKFLKNTKMVKSMPDPI
jgi:hypothetical protein